MKHEVSDWEPVQTDSGLVMQYRCKFCKTLIDAVVILCAEQDAAELRAQLPGRLIFGLPGRDGWREMGDGRAYAALTGAPKCTGARDCFEVVGMCATHHQHKTHCDARALT